MQNILSEITSAEKRIDSSYHDLRTFAFQLCDEVMKNGTGSDIVIAPTLKGAVESALLEKNSIFDALNNSKNEIDSLESSKLKVSDLKKRLEENEKKIKDIKRVLGAIAFERAQAEECDQRLLDLLKDEIENFKILSQKRFEGSFFSKFFAKLKYRKVIKSQDSDFIRFFDIVDKNKLLKTIRSERSEALINDYQKLSKKQEIIKRRLKSRQSEVDSLKNSHTDDSVEVLQDNLKNAESSYEEACISYGLFLFDNGSKWICANTSEKCLDLMTQMLQTQRYIESQHSYIKKCRAMILQDDYSAMIGENDKKIASLKKEIARINDQIAEIENENSALTIKISKLESSNE